MDFDSGDSSWNFLDEFVIQVPVSGEDKTKDYFVEGRTLKVSAYIDKKLVWEDTKTVDYVNAKEKVITFIAPNDTLGCKTFQIKAEILGQTTKQEKSKTHTAACGE